MTSVHTGKGCGQAETAVHLRILLRGLRATSICAQGRLFSRVLLLLLLLATILRRRLWKATSLTAMLSLAQPLLPLPAAVAYNLLASACEHFLLNWHRAWDQSADRGWMCHHRGWGWGPWGKGWHAWSAVRAVRGRRRHSACAVGRQRRWRRLRLLCWLRTERRLLHRGKHISCWVLPSVQICDLHTQAQPALCCCFRECIAWACLQTCCCGAVGSGSAAGAGGAGAGAAAAAAGGAAGAGRAGAGGWAGSKALLGSSAVLTASVLTEALSDFLRGFCAATHAL